MKKLLILLIIIIPILMGCSKSLVYSPGMSLPVQTLKKGEMDMQGGFELFPEARAEKLGGRKSTLGLNGQFGIGLSDNVNMSIRHWTDIEYREEEVRFGISLTTQFIKRINTQQSILFMPRAGIAFNGNSFDLSEGYGLGLSTIYHRRISKNLAYYGGGGLLWGFHELNQRQNDNDQYKVPMGIGLIGNFGLSWEFAKKTRLNIEINPLYQINTFDETQQFIISPQIGIGYTIRGEEKRPKF